MLLVECGDYGSQRVIYIESGAHVHFVCITCYHCKSTPTQIEPLVRVIEQCVNASHTSCIDRHTKVAIAGGEDEYEGDDEHDSASRTNLVLSPLRLQNKVWWGVVVV